MTRSTATGRGVRQAPGPSNTRGWVAGAPVAVEHPMLLPLAPVLRGVLEMDIEPPRRHRDRPRDLDQAEARRRRREWELDAWARRGLER